MAQRKPAEPPAPVRRSYKVTAPHDYSYPAGTATAGSFASLTDDEAAAGIADGHLVTAQITAPPAGPEE